MFKNIFLQKKIIPQKLISYGFEEYKGKYKYSVKIMEDSFLLEIIIDKNSTINTKLIELENGEEYILYKTNSSGKFVGKIRSDIEEVLSDISAKCYEIAVFKFTQSIRLIKYIYMINTVTS